MAKLACKACGGKVMAKGGVASKAIKKVLPKAKMGLNYGIPQIGTTNYSAATMKKGGRVGAIKKMELGGDPGDGKPNSVLKNLGIFGGAGALIGLLTTQKGIDRRAKKTEARYEKRQLKKNPPIEENKQITKSKRGGSINKK
jgi:uncharacterized protein YneF (UPF0154 family)